MTIYLLVGNGHQLNLPRGNFQWLKMADLAVPKTQEGQKESFLAKYASWKPLDFSED